MSGLIDAAKITAALALIALSLGCSYDYGYFHDIGFNYFTLLTYKDHLSATVYFVPPTLVLSLPWLARRKWASCDFIGCAILGLTILFWTALDPGPDILGVGVARVFYNIKAVLTALGICYLTSVLIDVEWFWKFTDQMAARYVAILVSAALVLILFCALGGVLAYRNAMDAQQFDTQLVFAKDAGVEDKAATAFILRFVDNGLFLVLQREPDRLAYVRREAVNVVSRRLRRAKQRG